jgi:hypothetical protein
MTTTTPTARSPLPTASGAPSAGRVASAAFGFVASRPDLVIRTETDPEPVVTLEEVDSPGAGGGAATSADGRRLAYWTQAGTGRNELRLWDAATPDRTVMLATSPDDERGTGAVWSSDGTGLLLSFRSLTVQPGIDAPPDRTALRTIDVASRQLTEVTRAERTFFAPLAWDRARQLVAAVEIGAGGFARAYVLVRGGQVTRTTLNNVIFVVGSADASWIVASTDVQTQARILGWPIAEPVRVIELRPDPERALFHGGFLPRSTRVIVVDRPRVVTGAPFTASVHLWDVATGQRLAIPNGTTEGIAEPRADGTALYVASAGALQVMDVKTGAREALPGPSDRIVAGVILR